MKRFLYIIALLAVGIAGFFLVSAKQPDSKMVAVTEAKTPVTVPNKVFPIIPHKEEMTTAIASYFNKALAQHKIVGASVAIVKCDSVIYTQGFGRRDFNQNLKVNAETIFRIGSVSKGFGGVLAGIQVENKQLDWDDKMVDYLPDFKLASSSFTNDITISNILSHSSGMPYHSFTNLIEHGLSLSKIEKQFEAIQPIDVPGAQYSYQNAIFAMSGHIIENLHCRPLHKILKDQIFDPLQMKTASATYEDLVSFSNIAVPHRKVYRGWKPLKIHKNYYNAVVAGGINASATDMAQWMKFMLGHNPEVLSTEGLAQVLTPQIRVPGRYKYYQRWVGYKSSSYAHGWRIHSFDKNESGLSGKVIHHGGHVNNYRSEVAIFPEEDLGICILFNSPTKLARTVIPDLYEIIVNQTQHHENDFQTQMVGL